MNGSHVNGVRLYSQFNKKSIHSLSLYFERFVAIGDSSTTTAYFLATMYI